MRRSTCLTLVAGSATALWAGLASAQCEMPWFEPRVLDVGSVIGAFDTDGDGLAEAVASDRDGMAVWGLAQGPAPVELTRFFHTPVNSPVSADFNGDGAPDIAAITDDFQAVRVFLYAGGTWSELANIGVDAQSIFVIDHLGDGDPDLFIIDGDGAGRVLSNPGDGSLTDIGVVVPGQLTRATPARLTPDARTDLYLSFGSTSAESAVYLQQADGSFLPGPPPDLSPHLLADVNNDGLDDILINAAPTLVAYTAVGDGSFAGATTLIAADLYPEFAADFDGDGDTDLVCYENTPGAFAVYRNQNGQFAGRGQVLPDFSTPDSLRSADIDTDGLPELFGNLRSGVAILRNRGDCTFRLPHSRFIDEDLIAPLARRMTTGDLDGDGDLDAVILAGNLEGAAVVMRNESNGAFTAVLAEVGADGEEGYEAPVLADFDGDGDPDIAFWVDELIVILENTPDGSFSTRHDIPAGQALLGLPLLASDFDRNGLPDLLYPPTVIGESPTMLLNQGGWSFAAQPLAADPYPAIRALTDLTGDGIPDLVGTNRQIAGGELGVMPGRADGTFGAPIASDLINPFGAFVFPGDFDGDGARDLLVAPSTGNRVHLLLGAGEGGFTDAGEVATYASPRGIGVADYNGDGIDDFVAGSQTDGSVGLHLAAGGGAFAEPILLPLNNSVTAAPGDFNGDGALDILVLGNRGQSGPGVITSLLNQCGPDTCPVDLNADRFLNSADVIAYLGLWASGSARADWNHDGSINTTDLVAFLNDWTAGC